MLAYTHDVDGNVSINQQRYTGGTPIGCVFCMKEPAERDEQRAKGGK